MKLTSGEREGAAIERALTMMGLGPFARSYPAQLSGGMRQRVCIARTLVTEPRLILLDEPFGALDQQTRLLMGDEVLQLWRKTGATVFLITHALDEAAMLADRIGVMSARPGPADRHRRDRLAARPRQPHRRRRRVRRDHRPAVEVAARGIDEGDRQARWRGPTMKPVGALADRPSSSASSRLLEVLCLAGVIDKLTMQPPHIMVLRYLCGCWPRARSTRRSPRRWATRSSPSSWPWSSASPPRS